jgi:hypothetical protein
VRKHLNKLIERFRLLEENDVVLAFSIPVKFIHEISEKLNIILPDDFTEINKTAGHAGFSTMQFSRVLNNRNEIIEDNERLRKWYNEESQGKSDMSHILVLSDDDGGSVFMITQDSPEKPTPIIWCDAGDMFHYSINGVFSHPHDEWPSFTDFFEYLVEKEEEKLREDDRL